MASSAARRAMARWDWLRSSPPGRGAPSQQAHPHHQPHQAAGGGVDLCFAHLAGLDGGQQLVAEPFGRAGHLQVEAGVGRGAVEWTAPQSETTTPFGSPIRPWSIWVRRSGFSEA